MKLDDLRARMRTQEDKPKPIPLEKRPCPKCGRKRKKEIVDDGILQLSCESCGMIWQASVHKCGLCQDELVGNPDTPCKLCVACSKACSRFFSMFLATPNKVLPTALLAHRESCPECSECRRLAVP